MRGMVRHYLAEHTRGIHEALHRDPVLACLTRPDLAEGEYRNALIAFSSFYSAVERARSGAQAWQQFGLATECAALREDVGAAPIPKISCPLPLTALSRDAAILGALYVAHGAGFGRASMRANALKALPHLSHKFLGLPTPVSRWRTLVSVLDVIGASETGLSAALSGAETAFTSMREAASVVCASTAPA